jgi:hypothetical protein
MGAVDSLTFNESDSTAFVQYKLRREAEKVCSNHEYNHDVQVLTFDIIGHPHTT